MNANFWRDCPLVETVPGKLDGRPVIKDTRVEADLIPESLADLTPEQIASVYRLKLKDVLAVQAYYLAHIDNPVPVR